jgi:hypothetical protein
MVFDTAEVYFMIIGDGNVATDHKFNRLLCMNKSWLHDPWANSNLHRNPFGELTRAERAEVAIVDVEQIAAWVAERRTAVQFVGECGRGKTTRMLTLARQLPDAAYVYLPEDGPGPPIPQGRVVLIDEAQRLPRSLRRAVFSTGLPLVLGTHRDLVRPLRRHGYTVHTQRIGHENTPELVCRVLNRRIESSRRGPGPIPVITLDFARSMVGRFGTDIRSIEDYLYELVQTQVIDHGQVRFED